MASMNLGASVKDCATFIRLPPLPPSPGVVRELLELVFNQYCWFQPIRFGRSGDEARLVAGTRDFSAVAACYSEFRRVTVSGRTEQDFLTLSPSRVAEYPFVGKLIWNTSLAVAERAEWRAGHLHQVMEVMRLLDSPLAYSAARDDLHRKTQRFIPSPDGIGTEQTFTLRDPSEGLTGLFWRNFYGPPFTRMFGERLLSLPPGSHQDLGDGLVLVQPYELPSQAMTPEGDAAEARLITVLGPECFYDFQHHQKPTRVPMLSPGPA